MQITGHKTRAMFDRYNIVPEADLADAAAKLHQFRSDRQSPFGPSAPRQTDTKTDTTVQKKKGD